MPLQPLLPEVLRCSCNPHNFSFETTAELNDTDTIIGQPRGVRAIEFGIGIPSHGYNVFVVGEIGASQTQAIERFLQSHAIHQSVPHDWMYVHNFTVPHQPKAIALPAGVGREFKAGMGNLLTALKKDLPEAFNTEAYEEAAEHIRQIYKGQRDALLETLRTQASADGMAIVTIPSGFVVAPMVDGKAMTADEYQQLPVDEYQMLEKKRQTWGEELDEVLRKMRELDKDVGEQLDTLNREVAGSTIKHYFEQLRQKYEQQEAVLPYFEAVYADVLDNLADFAPDDQDEEREVDWRRYEVNLLVDNGPRLDASPPAGAPVVVELNPRFTDLLGRMEYEMQYGVSSTHFTNIKPGSLHIANGGYLVINARDLLSHRHAWEALKRTIKTGEIKLQTPDRSDGGQVLAKSLDPAPIPLKVKILLLGNGEEYYRLYSREEDFSELFKVKAEFSIFMPRDEEHEMAYAKYIASRCREENLRHFDRTAVSLIIEYGSREAGYQHRLTTQFGIISDVIREASYWAGRNQHEVVMASDVKQALEERAHRSNLEEERTLEYIREGSLFISTDGRVVGQVNGLSVIDVGDYAYGQPGRITARTFKGERGIVNIDREVDLTGPLHHKGMLTLIGYLGGKYAQERPLSLSASVTFEQNYGTIEGDSAASAELYSILSSLGNLPIKQGIAVTGSVNQLGQIQPIGGTIEKVEGFFTVCKARGLTGEQGVIIPVANLRSLMLNDEVIQAVEEKKFHIWAVQTIEEGMEILTDTPAGEPDAEGNYPEGTLHYAVMQGILRLSKDADEEEEEPAEVETKE